MIASEWNALQSPNNKVLGPNGVLMGNNGSGLVSPTAISNMAAWYDLSDTTSLIKDSSDRIQLIEDKSGLSEDNALVLPGVSGNYASVPALAPAGTGNLSLSVKMMPAELSSDMVLLGSEDNGIAIQIDSVTAELEINLVGVGLSSRSTGTVSALTEHVIGYTKSGTTGTFYIDGIAAGTITDSYNYSVGISGIGASRLGVTNVFGGNIKWARVYDEALDATAMAADAAGTIQADNIFAIDFADTAKLATSVTASTGQTVTINQTATALPARIQGARDLYMGSASDQPKYLGYDGTNYGYMPTGVGSTSFGSDANVDLTGDIDLVSFIRYDSSTGSFSELITDLGGLSGEAEISLTSGTLRLGWYEGGTLIEVISSAHSVATGTDIYFRAKRVNDDGGIYKVYFYKSTDGSSWTLISSHNGAGVASPTSSISALEVGTGALAGLVYKVEAWQGDSTAGGTLVADLNPADYTSGSTFVSSATGETWTIENGAHIVTRTGAYFDGSDHYMKSAPFSLSQPENVYLVGEQVDWRTRRSIFEGNSTGTMKLGTPTTSGASPSIVLGTNTSPLVSDWLIRTCAAVCALFNSASSELRVNRNAAAVSDIGTANGDGFTLAARPNGARSSNIFVSEALIYDTVAHDTATQDLIALYAGNKWGFSV